MIWRCVVAGGAYLEPVVAVLTGDMAGYTAMLTEAQARMAEFVASQLAAMTAMEERMATLGVGAGEGLAAEGGVAAVVAEDVAAMEETTAAARAATMETVGYFDAAGEALITEMRAVTFAKIGRAHV